MALIFIAFDSFYLVEGIILINIIFSLLPVIYRYIFLLLLFVF